MVETLDWMIVGMGWVSDEVAMAGNGEGNCVTWYGHCFSRC